MNVKRWTTDHIPDLTGKVVIVTGGNTGIGLHAATELAAKGAEVILACRNEKKALKAISRINKNKLEGRVRYLYLDLASLNSVRQFAGNFRDHYSRLDILLNNAGIILYPYRTTEDGFESQMGINHLGHFALTGHLMDLIIKTEGSRVVNVSSKAHKVGWMDFDNFLFEGGKGYSRIAAYARSKLANLLFTYELDRRFNCAGIQTNAVASHPGFAYTGFGRYRLFIILKYMFYPVVRLVTQSASMGALPSIRAAVDPGVLGADYIGPGGHGERKGYPVKVKSNGASHHAEDARRLWEISETLTGVKYLST